MASIRESLLTATDEDIITTSEKYVETQLMILNKVDLPDDKKEEIRKNIKYVSACCHTHNITALQTFFSKLKIDDCGCDEETEFDYWFWLPLAILD